MNYRLLSLVVLIAGGLAAEDAAPAATTPAATTPALRTVHGARVARVSGAAPEWDILVRQSASWDSNALLESSPDTVASASAVYSTDATLGWRPLANERNFFKTSLSAGFDRRPQLIDMDSSHLGLSAAYAHQGEVYTSGASMSVSRYWLDGKGAAAELRGGYSLGKVRTDSVDLASLELGAIHFDSALDQPDRLPALTNLGSADDRSGVLTALGYRHWWVLPQQSRIEIGVRGGRFFANSETETYNLLQPFAACRFKEQAWNLMARATLETRVYEGAATAGSANEHSNTATLSTAADRRIGRGFSLGGFATAAVRASSLDDRDYWRWQAGLRLIWAYTPVEE